MVPNCSDSMTEVDGGRSCAKALGMAIHVLWTLFNVGNKYQ